jgi:hypothetical protein
MKATFTSGGVEQRITDVLAYDHTKGTVLVICHPDVTPRWVSLAKPQIKEESE